MTTTDRMEIARRAVAEFGQAEVARRIGKSGATVSQVLSGKYTGNTDGILELIEAAFASTTIDCQVMGEVFLADCIDARRRAQMPFFPSSSQAAELHRLCPKCKGEGK